ncbi:hypothetical protein GCM10023205_76990 [Yinghuangia aomiensis]|uniref:Secreted protein/lipoprotein n=2 Tax=Yinghuangia aomiensis TaxID=676205 RepID=A0ABP9IAW9_9ACTN
MAGVFLAAAGCSSDSGSDAAASSPPPAPSSPSAPASPSAEDQAREQVLAAYAKYAAASDRVQHEGRAPAMGGDEKTYMTDKARTEYQAIGLDMEAEKTRVTGDVVRTPAVTVLDLASTPPRATITACLDVSAIKLVDAAGKPVTTNVQAPRYVQTAALVRDGDGGAWRVDGVTSDRQRTC